MGRIFFGSGSFVPKRLPQDVNQVEGITNYGADNLYPQRMEQIRLRSPLTKRGTEVLADFINGDGWENNGDIELNQFGHTANDILTWIAWDDARYNGWALHFNFNGNGRIIETQYTRFEYVRFGVENAMGLHSEVKVSRNWEEDQRKTITDPRRAVLDFPLFNPRTAQLETIRGGNGQVMYITQRPDDYPLTTYDAFATSSELEDEIQIYSLNNTMSGFHGTSLFKYPGDLSDDESEAEINAKVGQITGSSGPGMMVIEVDEDFTGNIIESIPADNRDTLFLNTFNQTRDMIIQGLGIPKPLLAVAPQNTVFTQQQIADSYRFFNIVTKNRRNKIERIFAKVGALMEPTVDFGSIKAQTFQAEQEAVVKTNPPEVEREEIQEAEVLEPQQKLIKLYGN